MTFYIFASKEIVELAVEKNDDFAEMEILFETDSLENAQGYVCMTIDNGDRTSYLEDFKHIKIVDSEGMEHQYNFQYAWMPKSAWIRLNPPPAELKDLVKVRGVHLRPNLLKLIQAHEESQTEAAE